MLGANEVFFGSAIVFVLLIPLVWFARPRRGAAAGAGGAH